MGGQCYASATLPPEKEPLPSVQEAGWVPEPVWTGAENLAFTRIRYPDRSARSESLYRLIYPGPRPQVNTCKICDGQGDSGTICQRVRRFASSASCQQCSTFIFVYMLLVPDGQTAEAWEPSKKQCYFGNLGALDRKVRRINIVWAS